MYNENFLYAFLVQVVVKLPISIEKLSQKCQKRDCQNKHFQCILKSWNWFMLWRTHCRIIRSLNGKNEIEISFGTNHSFVWQARQRKNTRATIWLRNYYHPLFWRTSPSPSILTTKLNSLQKASILDSLLFVQATYTWPLQYTRHKDLIGRYYVKLT